MVSTDAPPLSADLRATLTRVAGVLDAATRPWWIIAGAAAALHGLPGEVGDVDVLLDADDARRLLLPPGVCLQEGGGSDRFRSGVFARWTAPPMAVEFMADFACHGADGWQRIAPASRVAVTIGGTALFVPDRGELAAMFRMFGRPKDHARAALLDAMGGAAPTS